MNNYCFLIQHGELKVSNGYRMWLDQRGYAHSCIWRQSTNQIKLDSKSHLSHLLLAAVCFIALLCLLVCSRRRRWSSASSDRLSAKKRRRNVDPFWSAIRISHLFTKYMITSDVKRRVDSMTLNWSFYVWTLLMHIQSTLRFEAI